MREKEEKNPMVTASEAFSCYVRKKELHMQLGPSGNSSGSSWDDGCHQRIESIFVSYSGDYIHSIQIVYKDFNNDIFRAPQHGQYAYSYTFEAVHPPPETPITRLDAYYKSYGISCLELSTNNGKLCSFGTKTGSPFIYKDPRGFTGFHGRHNGHVLTALGVYVNTSAIVS
ncbi:jacalin-related lectin 33-like [Carex rostrata]